MDAAIKLIERTNETLKTLEDKEIERLTRALDAAYLDLEKELLRRYPNYTADAQPSLLATQRGLLLMHDLQKVLTLINPDQAEAIEKRFNTLLQTASQSGVSLSDELLNLQRGESFVKQNTTIPIEAVAIAAKDAVRRLSKHSEAFREAASVIVTQGLVQGWGAMKTAQQLRGQLGVTKGRAETIARTETMTAQNQAAQQNYKANGVEHFQWIATSDDRLCPRCAARNGNVYELGRVPIPGHPRCRCYPSPIKLEWIEQGLVDTKWIEKFRADGLKELEATGQQPNDGLMPFEKAAGMTKAPEPAWRPEIFIKTQSSRLEELDRQLLQLEPLTPEYNSKLKEYAAEENRVQQEQSQAKQRSYQRYIDKGQQVFEASGVASVLSQQISEYQQASPTQKRTITREMREVMDTWRRAMLAASSVSQDAAAKLVANLEIDIENETIREKLIPRHMAEFFQLTQGKGSRRLKRIFSDPKERRAYAVKDAINVGLSYDPSTLLHELGHHVEFEDPKLLEAAKNWIESRASGPPKSMNRLVRTKGYDDDETAYPDKFIDPYVGKVYFSATEVLSMGLEYFWDETKMLELYRKDPEHFYFILGALLS